MIKSFLLPQGIPYREVLEMQQEAFVARVNARREGLPIPEDIVLIAEHNPVYTLGRHGDISNLLISAEALEQKNIDFVKINRGGDITYHGPGQLTVYPIIDLLRYKLGVKDYVNLLEQTVIDTLVHYGISATRIPSKTGVWVYPSSFPKTSSDPSDSEPQKICAIGIRCSRHITMHGFALNVSPDLSYFSGIVPCGLHAPVTSISALLGRSVPLPEVASLLVSNLSSLLQQ
ncbi:MAG: lipoyl(octanoyl) transferase LipB [Muribaculaceae bacterium]|nr:lipoyl(octanoyl) transferase LipB [Muribaculaceae bacterium]